MFAPFGGVDVGPGEIIVIKAPQFKKARELRDLQHQADMALIKLEALDLDMEIASSDEDSNESCSCIDSEEERDSESDEESEEMETNTMPK